MSAIQSLIQTILRGHFYYGQYRLFGWFFKKKLLQAGKVKTVPIEGDFSIICDTNTWIGASIVYMGDYEPETKKVFKQLVRSGDTVLDIGANIGFHSLYLAQFSGDSGRVIAVEPVLMNYQELETNIRLNNASNIIPVQKAFSNRRAKIGIDADPDSINPGAYSLYNEGDTYIEALPGDELLAELGIGRIHFIKIDVEGYELQALRGLENTLRTYQPAIVFEYDKTYQEKSGKSGAELFGFLNSLGYRFQAITRHGLQPLNYSENILSAQVYAAADR